MQIQLTLNGEIRELEVYAGESLLDALRRSGCWSVKHGCDTGECGACAIVLDGRLVPSCILPAEAGKGKVVETIEGLSAGLELHPIQQAFVDTGAIQCGFCTPGMILAAKTLLDKEKYPTLDQARQSLSAVLCRCTGYVKPVEAILRAAALLRGDEVPPIDGGGIPIEQVFGSFDYDTSPPPTPEPGQSGSIRDEPTLDVKTQQRVITQTQIAETPTTQVVGRPEVKVDAVKLAKGKPVFTDDMNLPGMLHAALLTSPHAHARIREIDVSRARALPGVHAVLTYKDVARVMYASGGQTYPNPPPWDQVSLDSKVRHVGDRVAVVAAEDPQTARQALELIEVDYEVLPAILNAEESMKPGAPLIHDEPDAIKIADANRNLAAQLHAEVGNVELGLSEADHIIKRTYRVHKVQQASIENHVCITYWDEDDRLVIRTSTQVPFHVRRMVAPLIGLPVKRIRVIKPRIGGGFGGKQEMLIEDLCAHLTIVTNRPVRFEYTREQEFTSSRSRHPQVITYRAGVMRDGSLRALDMHVLSDTGAYGAHGLTVCSVTGFRGLATYRCPNIRFTGDIVYTNTPSSGAFRGYGAPQALFALESLMEEIAAELHLDPVAFRLQNALRVGDPILISSAVGEGEAAAVAQVVTSCALPECVEQAGVAIDWNRRSDPGWRIDPERPHIRRGLGMAVAMHGTSIPGLDMGAASIKMNDDGSFNLLVGATDLGTGSDTVLAQIAAETLGVPLEDIIIYSSDTDFTPFDVGAYASSTTYISGGAVMKACEQVRAQIFERAALMVGCDTQGMYLKDRHVHTPEGLTVSLSEVALHSLHRMDQQQIMATASQMSSASPPPFGAQYAQVEVDIETGQVTVLKLVMAVDCGTAINPVTAIGQIEGGQIQALGYAISEEMPFDAHGQQLATRLGDYRIFAADEVPEIQSILVPTYEPTGPYGAKAVAEIPMDAVAPAIANAIFHATGVRMRSLPFTPERVWRALQASSDK